MAVQVQSPLTNELRLQLDQTTSVKEGAARVSLYGKAVSAADTAVGASSSGALNVSIAAVQSLYDAAIGCFAMGMNGTGYDLGVALNVYNGGAWDRQRTPLVFKVLNNVPITAGTPVAIWTPAAGKKFRLMGYQMSVNAGAALLFKDATTLIYVSGLIGASTSIVMPAVGNGILSALANNVLNLDLSASTTVWGTVWGTEE